MSHFQWSRFWAPVNVNINEHDFLPDPETLWGDKRLIQIEDIEDIPCLILLGHPGIGKSVTIRNISATLQTQGKVTLFKDFREYSTFSDFIQDIEQDEVFCGWSGANSDVILHLLLDSLDEGRLEIKRLEHDLQRWIKSLSTSRLRLYITCRSAELPADFPDLMRNIWKDNRQVQIYYLAQLREKDVLAAAQQHLGEAGDAFINGVRSRGLQAFAAHPVTFVNMLLPLFKQNGTLPETRESIYYKGCKQLLKEVSRSRHDDAHTGQFDVTRRKAAAEEIALLSVLGNRPRISRINLSNDNSVLNVSDLQDMDFAAALLSETLGTALFLPMNETYYWAHRSYAEFLAANRIAKAKLSLVQIQSLFVNPTDPDRKIAPKLHETVAWLASLRPDVFDWLLSAEPMVLIKSRSIQLTSEQKEMLIEHYIQKYNKHKVIDDRLQWDDYQRLSFPQMGKLLQKYLIGGHLEEKATKFVLDLVIMCEVSDINQTLIDLVLDTHSTSEVRRLALEGLERFGSNESLLVKLRPIVDNRAEFGINLDSWARIVDLLWPTYLPSEVLFDHLSLPHREDLTGDSPYNHLLSYEIIKRLEVDDLPIALRWVIRESRRNDHEVAYSGRDFIIGIMQRAWDHLNIEAIRVEFARAAWTRMQYFNPLLQDRQGFRFSQPPDRNYAQEIIDDHDKRHLLLNTMLDISQPSLLSDTQVIFALLDWSRSGIPFVIREDASWLIFELEQDIQSERSIALALLLDRILSYEDIQAWERIYNICERRTNKIILAHFGERFAAWDLGSEKAESAKRSLEEKRKWEREDQLIPDATLTLEQLEQWVEVCERDSTRWLHLSQGLIADRNGQSMWWEWQWNVTSGYGWELICDNQSLVLRVSQVALDYVKRQSPLLDKGETSVALTEQYEAIAGYQALALLEIMNSSHLLSKEDWERWAEVVVDKRFYHHFQNEDEGLRERIDSSLLQNVFLHSSDKLINLLSAKIQKGVSASEFEVMLKRYQNADKAQLENMLLGHMDALKSNTKLFVALIQYLLRNQGQASAIAYTKAIDVIDSLASDEIDLVAAIPIFELLARVAPDNKWWSVAWKLLSYSDETAKSLLAVMIDLHRYSYLDHLTHEELTHLYALAVRLFPYSEDRQFYGGIVPDYHRRQEWRDGILKTIAARGTRSSIEFLRELLGKVPQPPSITYLVEQAITNFRFAAWTGLDLQEIRQLLSLTNARLVHNADQLIETLLEAIAEIQHEYRGSSVKKNSLWNKSTSGYTPGDEAALSDAMTEWLREKIKGVIINREAQLRLSPLSADRTDIQIEMARSDGSSFIVIIEVKGCWHKDLADHMQSQLVDQYIEPNKRCSHGIYLIGFFAPLHWDASDSRRRKCKSIEDLKTLLERKVSGLRASKIITVKPVIFDASM